MKPGEIVVAVAGVACLVFAGALAVIGRPPEIFVLAGVALLVVGMVGSRLQRLIFGAQGLTIEQSATVVMQALDEDQPPDLKLTVAHSYAFGGSFAFGSEHVLTLTAVNTGSKPIGINSLGVRLNDRRWAPFTHTMPTAGNRALPTILQPQEAVSVYNDYDGMVASLRDEGIRITAIVANLVDGSEREVPVPDNIAKLPDKSDS